MLLKYIIALGVFLMTESTDMLPARSLFHPAPRYRAAGVNLEEADLLVKQIKPLAARTDQSGILGGIGGFGAMIEIPKGFQKPVLVCGADGVGTKLMLAREYGVVRGLGMDLVAMCVNDILAHGAKPLFFADYYASGELNADSAADVIDGIVVGCERAGCPLVGGETAEMPGLYKVGDFDLAGFAVGIVEKSKIINPSLVKAGDVVLGLASSGPHSNGFSLIRQILKEKNISLNSSFDGATLGDKLVEPTLIYAKSLCELFSRISVHGVAHITGGGIADNLERVLPPEVTARIDSAAWIRPPIFDFLQKRGEISDDEMSAVFNCGIGIAIIVSEKDAEKSRGILESHGETVFNIGKILPADATNSQKVTIR